MDEVDLFFQVDKKAKEFIDELVSGAVTISGDFPSLDRGTVTRKKKDKDEEKEEE
jgi:hypothetical protein